LEEKDLKNEISEQKRVILDKLVNSGINITPTMLDWIVNLDNPMKNLNIIIKETSFIPTFKNHLTETVLKEISNEEIQRALKRIISRSNSFSMDVKSINTKDVLNSSSKPVTKMFNNEVTSISSETQIKTSKSEDRTQSTPTYTQLQKIPAKKKIKTKTHESTKSTFIFKPVAKDYDIIFEILKDPTGKLHTNGKYDEFYELTLDKFNQLRKLIRRRPEVNSATNINNIFRLSNSAEISTIGLVNNIHITKKGNYLLTLEDLTGLISVLIQNNSDNLDYIKIIERTIKDQMLFVKGTFNPGEKGRRGIIFANSISKIDIPTNFQPNKSSDPLSIALISDIHIGSKEFEEGLFKKFLNFLNGRSNNKSLRDVAGKIKYLVINGDLVDGIGIYPNQQKDLIITDIYEQFKKASDLLSEIPDYIQIFYVSGNHEPVRNALPLPAVPKKYCEDLINLGIKCLGNPSLIKTHNVNTLIYHGESMHDMNMLIPDLDISDPIETMKEFLICRHLAPTFGEKTQLAPINKDLLLLDKIPDIFHTGHVHINGTGKYRNVTLVNSGCFQAQTDYMRSFGIIPTPGIVPIVELDTLNFFTLDFKKID
jgi:DNA polymerase II small subunit